MKLQRTFTDVMKLLTFFSQMSDVFSLMESNRNQPKFTLFLSIVFTNASRRYSLKVMSLLTRLCIFSSYFSYFELDGNYFARFCHF